jgi:hypothetical protein
LIPAADLKKGSVYFMVTYEDPGLCRAITLSYEYLGRDPYGEPVDPSESGFYFKYLSAFRLDDAAGSGASIEGEIAQVPYCCTEEQLKSFLDIDGLIAELNELRKRLKRQP